MMGSDRRLNKRTRMNSCGRCKGQSNPDILRGREAGLCVLEPSTTPSGYISNPDSQGLRYFGPSLLRASLTFYHWAARKWLVALGVISGVRRITGIFYLIFAFCFVFRSRLCDTVLGVPMLWLLVLVETCPSPW